MELVIDIHFDPYSSGISSILSNLFAKPFIMDETAFGSIEGFLQGLKFEDVDKQSEIFKLSGITAKKSGRVPIIDDTLYYKGYAFDRHSEYYQLLLDKAYLCCFNQNTFFRDALSRSRNIKLTHDIGKTDPNDTILTVDEFISRLEKFR